MKLAISRLTNVIVTTAALLCAPLSASAVNISFFNDAGFVDTGTEASNMRADLVGLGNTVTNFTGTSSAAWTAALAGADVVVIPELQNGDLSSSLTAGAKTALTTFVTSGGGFIDVFSNANTFQQRAANLIFDITGVSLTPTGSSLTGGSSILNVANAAGTAFAGGVTPVSHPSGTGGVTTASTPGGTSIYTSGLNTTVFATGAGSGFVVGLGFDWFNPPAQWTEVLGDAVDYAAAGTQAVPEPTTLALMGLGLAGIGYKRHRSKIAA